nr:immunoglobulin heavy chain junction region [Macaca mulatta]
CAKEPPSAHDYIDAFDFW